MIASLPFILCGLSHFGLGTLTVRFNLRSALLSLLVAGSDLLIHLLINSRVSLLQFFVEDLRRPFNVQLAVEQLHQFQHAFADKVLSRAPAFGETACEDRPGIGHERRGFDPRHLHPGPRIHHQRNRAIERIGCQTDEELFETNPVFFEERDTLLPFHLER